jgi:hypothetical protein
MERLAQYLDDLEDLYFAIGLLMEKIRRASQVIALVLASIVVQVGGIALALTQPPIALSVVCLTIVGMLYRSATGGDTPFPSAS